MISSFSSQKAFSFTVCCGLTCQAAENHLHSPKWVGGESQEKKKKRKVKKKGKTHELER